MAKQMRGEGAESLFMAARQCHLAHKERAAAYRSLEDPDSDENYPGIFEAVERRDAADKAWRQARSGVVKAALRWADKNG